MGGRGREGCGWAPGAQGDWGWVGDISHLSCLVGCPFLLSRGQAGLPSLVAEPGRRGWVSRPHLLIHWASALALASSSAGFRALLPITLPGWEWEEGGLCEAWLGGG